MSIPETVLHYLVDHEIQYDLLSHSASFSAHDTALDSHVDAGHIAKGAIVKDRFGYAMVVLVASDC